MGWNPRAGLRYVVVPTTTEPKSDGSRTRGMSKPDWWLANERTRSEMDLPPYRPPRFDDGVYTHEVTEPLEAEFDCEVRFVGVNARHGEDWAVRVDGDPAFSVGRRRDEQGNTVYEVSSAAFERRVRAALGGESGGDADAPDGDADAPDGTG
jgi:hypothetical protein